MTAVKYSLDEFIYEMEALLKERPDQEKIFDNDLRGLNRCRYSLDTGKITPFATEKYDNC